MKKCLQMVMGILTGCMITAIACWVYETVSVGMEGKPSMQGQNYVQVEAEALNPSSEGEEPGSVTEAGESAEGNGVEGTPAGNTEDTSNVVTITISAAGDCSLGNHQEQEYNSSFVQAYDQAEDAGYFFASVKDIFSADDFTIVNLEGVLTKSTNADTSRTKSEAKRS